MRSPQKGSEISWKNDTIQRGRHRFKSHSAENQINCTNTVHQEVASDTHRSDFLCLRKEGVVFSMSKEIYSEGKITINKNKDCGKPQTVRGFKQIIKTRNILPENGFNPLSLKLFII